MFAELTTKNQRILNPIYIHTSTDNPYTYKYIFFPNFSKPLPGVALN